MSVLGNTAISFSDEQSMLLDYARSYCTDRGGVVAARQRLEEDTEFAPETWQEIVEMGWTGIGVDEAFGGAGLGIGAAVPVLESMGRALLGTPLMSSLLAAQLLQRANAEAAAEVLTAIVGGDAATVAQLESEDWGASGAPATLLDGDAVSGAKKLVMDGASARWIVVVASRGDETVLAVVDANNLPEGAVSPRVLMDNTHRAADIGFDAVPATLVIDGEAVGSALRDYSLLGALLVAAESAGAAATCLDTTVEYLKTRKQFGKLIGSYQALKHPAVEILSQVDNARSFIYHGATLVDDQALSKDAEIACRMAKAQATDTLKFAGDRAVQFHGGMGFTWDCDAQLFLRRAHWAQQQFGDAQHHRRRLGDLLL